MLCPPKSSQQEERDQERDRRNHALRSWSRHGWFLSTQTPFPLGNTSSVLWSWGWRAVLWSSPHCHPKHRVGLRPRQAQQCTPSILLQCPLRQTRQTWDIWWIHQESEALIQWASLAMWITSGRRTRGCGRPSLPRGAEREMESKRHPVFEGKRRG